MMDDNGLDNAGNVDDLDDVNDVDDVDNPDGADDVDDAVNLDREDGAAGLTTPLPDFSLGAAAAEFSSEPDAGGEGERATGGGPRRRVAWAVAGAVGAVALAALALALCTGPVAPAALHRVGGVRPARLGLRPLPVRDRGLGRGIRRRRGGGRVRRARLDRGLLRRISRRRGRFVA